MIHIKSNIETLRKNYTTRIKKLRRAGIRSQKKAAQLMVLEAKKLAPKRTGGIIRGLQAFHRVKYSKVISRVFKSFPYNLWVNETTPYKRIRLIPKFRPKGMKKRVRFFYSEVNVTGTPGYFTIATMKVAKVFPKIVLQNTRMALQATATTGGSLK